jgi:hypothetical protein
MHYVVTLVHGTWARSLAWTELRETLEARLPQNSVIQLFRWSGKNSVFARSAAAVDLQLHLYDWTVFRRSRPPYIPVGNVSFIDGRLRFASNQWLNANNEDGRVFAAKVIEALDSLARSSSQLCTIRTAKHYIMTEARITCGQRELSISAGTPGQKLGGSVSEVVRASQ